MILTEYAKLHIVLGDNGIPLLFRGEAYTGIQKN